MLRAHLATRPAGQRVCATAGRRLLAALERDFKKHGGSAIEKAREKDPVGYLRVVTGLLPKEVRPDASGDLADVLHDVGMLVREKREAARIIDVEPEPMDGRTSADQLPPPRPLHS